MIFELALIILIAAGLGIVAKFLRQPLILAYLAAGVIISTFGLLHLGEKETFQVFSDLGIMFLLFLVGLEINYTSLRLVGKPSLIVGIGQVIFTFIVGLFIAFLFGFSFLEASYIAIALTFSSTIIIVKLLSDKKDIHSLYGKISIGLMLVQDFIAILLLILLAGIQSGEGALIQDIFLTIFTGVLLFAIMLYLGRTLFPLIFDKIARSQELLFLTSLAWVFFVVALVKQFGFSIEIGGFLAGIALANSSEHFQIANRIRPLRDFFIVLFFVTLGSFLVITNFSGLAFPIIVFSLFVLVGNPLIILIIMGVMGYRRRTSFLTGLTVAQISEFSLVLAALGLKVGHISESTVALITAVGVTTITISTYMIVYADKLFGWFSPYLSLFERKHPLENSVSPAPVKKPIILIGFNRTGRSIALSIPKKDLLVIDFDPDVIKTLREEGFDYLFDDIADPEIFERINLKEARIIISTSPDFEDNMILLRELRSSHPQVRAKVIVRAETEEEAKLLYEQGAHYVSIPHFTAGEELGKLIKTDPGLVFLEKSKSKYLSMIQRENTL